MTGPRNWTTVIVSFVVLMATGCGSPDAPVAQSANMSETQNPDDIARRVVADFLSVPADDVAIVSSEAREFSDSSLGCPVPGMSYMQVLTPGHRVIAEADGRRFDIRVSGGHGKICHRQKPGTKTGRPTATEPTSAMVDVARRKLAELLQTDVGQVALIEVRPHKSDTVIPKCQTNCPAGTDCGYLIGFVHDGRRYDYHAMNGAVKPCPALVPM